MTAIETRGGVTCTPVQIINIEIKDTHEEATLGAFLILQLCDMVSKNSLFHLLLALALFP